MAKKDIKSSENKGMEKASGKQQMLTPFERMEQMFDNMFSHHRLWPRDPDWWPSFSEMASLAEKRMPKLDIIERDGEVMVRAELPGVDKKDVDVSVSDRTITIKGSSKKESKEEKGDYFRSEIRKGEFLRTATLPCEVDGEKSKANFKDGMLEITIPKVESSKRHNVNIE
jgi:HSP20 family protein